MEHEIGKDRLENPRYFGDTEPVETPEDQPTEEEQQDYDLLVIRARKMMFGKGRENILRLLGSFERPSKAMGKAAAMLVKSLIDAAKQSGRKISPEAAINAGTEIVEDLSELAKANGVFKYEDKDEELQEMQDAVLWGVKFYGDGEIANGEITPELQDQAAKQMEAGLAKEGAGMKKKPVSEGVEAAMSGKGLISGEMMKGGL